MSQAIILMGVSGCGKTTIGEELSRKTGWPFFDGDDFHPPENVAKMAAGNPLDDQDRFPWLGILNEIISEQLKKGQSLILACSALKQNYRMILQEGVQKQVEFVYLKGDFETIYQRMKSRQDHYMKAEMLRSQFAALEEPHQVLVVDVSLPVEDIVDMIIKESEIQAG